MTDARFTNHGSLIGIVPITIVAKEWIDEHVDTEGYQWFGSMLCAEPRYAHVIATAMVADGLIIE